MPLWAKAVVFLGLIGLASIGYFTSSLWKGPSATQVPTNESDPEEIAKRPRLDDFILTDGEGQQKKLSEFRGNVVILSFWASWCTPCLVELPTFAEIEKKFHGEGLRVLAVNVDEGADGKTFAKELWSKKSFEFPSFFDADKSLANKFEVDMLPANFVIDRQGRLAFSGFGANDWTSPQNIEFIENLLQESPTAAEDAAPAPQGG